MAGVEQTTNKAERTPRAAFLSKSNDGNRLGERMVTVIHTTKCRGMPILDEQACAAPTPDFVLRPCVVA